MIDPAWLFRAFGQHGIEFFTGVPDSLLKSICAYITDHVPAQDHVIAANEGTAMAIAAGYHLATGKLPLVYMQNSGVGNMVNPLLSLADPEVYSIPMVVMVGWRGEPGVDDEPQHVKQGRVMLRMFEAMEMPCRLLSDNPEGAAEDIAWVARTSLDRQCPVALVVNKQCIGPYQLREKEESPFPMSREEAIEQLVAAMDEDDIVVSTTGMISRELFELRRRRNEADGRDFLTVGSMGHASSIAFGVALKQPERRVFCIDGDGAMLMHMGATAILGRLAPANFRHIVLNNGCHDSVGGQPTVGFDVSLGEVARACGYTVLPAVEDQQGLGEAFGRMCAAEGPVLLEIRVRKGARKDLGRPTSTPLENKQLFMDRLERVKGIDRAPA